MGTFFWSVRLGLWLSLDAAGSFCPDVVGEGTQNSHRYEKFPSTSQSSSGIFLRRGNSFKPDDPNQVVRFEETPTNRNSLVLSLALIQFGLVEQLSSPHRMSSYGLSTYGLSTYGLSSYGLYSFGLVEQLSSLAHRLYSHGLSSYGLSSYGLYSSGPSPAP